MSDWTMNTQILKMSVRAYFKGSISAKMKPIKFRSFLCCAALCCVHLSWLGLQCFSALQQPASIPLQIQMKIRQRDVKHYLGAPVSSDREVGKMNGFAKLRHYRIFSSLSCLHRAVYKAFRYQTLISSLRCPSLSLVADHISCH